MKFEDLTLISAHEMLKKKEISAKELRKESIDVINRKDEKIGAFLTLSDSLSLKQAEDADKKISENNDSILTGIPFAIKDNISTKGVKTTCASKMLENYVPVYDASVVFKLYEKNAVMIGKTNMDEFAMGGSTEHSYFKLTKNPHDLNFVPGGSSGGSAAAVASGEVIYALGSDTGGSVRQPASFCGVVGLKPTYGRVSRYGLVAFGSSLDQIGILSKTTEDAAEVLKVISGFDEMDSTSSDISVCDYTENIKDGVKNLKIGVIKELFTDNIDPDIRSAVSDTIKTLEENGAKVEFISLKHIAYSVAAYYIIAPSEASSNLSRFDGVKYGYRAKDYSDLEEMYINTRSEAFGEEVKRRIILGTYALSSGYYDEYYKKALKVRTLICRDFKDALNKYDILLSPAAPSTAFPIASKINDPISMYLEDLCTIPANLAGLPAISVPCGKKDNLPFGIQIVGNYFKEKELLQAAYFIERARESEVK